MVREPDQQIVNDFSIVVATVNGTGSQTANMALLRSLFRMGVPVNSRNLFPSNIQGLPTWFTIRASTREHFARSESTQILVLMNETTYEEDLAMLEPGSVCFYADHFEVEPKPPGVICYPMPVKDIVREASPPKQLRDYMTNMVYVGVIAEMLGIDLSEIQLALETHFQGNPKPVDLNMGIVDQAALWARENLTKEDPYVVRRDDKTRGKILIDGNTAAALGAIYGGLTFAAWYPITPASSLADGVLEYLPRLRRDPESDDATCAVIQAEDEISAIGMAIGAGWAGARAMTSTSGPGISLMAEFAGLAFFAEVPVVIWDVQRMGPSTGLPTRTSQGDILFVRFLGHGDTKQVMLLPGNMAECFEFGWRAFDIAERLQTPVFVLSDLDLGMNLWMSEPFTYPDEPMDRGKVLSAEDLDRIGEFARYRDVDGDGIPYRTLPGTNHPLAPWFARGTGHDESAFYSEDPEVWTRNIERLWRKMETAREYMPKPILRRGDTPEAVGIIVYGSTNPAVHEARHLLAEQGLPTDYLRIRAIPFTDEIETFIREHERIYVVEMNQDGQMRQLLQLEYPDQAVKLRSLTHNDGISLTGKWVADAVTAAEQN
ncbi:MAG TPA: 2-oxoacid:acceptor oxidoreductase subunit alpha [Anaerolineae bacterium]|nr:2-oxoacid:acceptor oxidoreductase subunit alpha [Anaerolineae bacterium]